MVCLSTGGLPIANGLSVDRRFVRQPESVHPLASVCCPRVCPSNTGLLSTVFAMSSPNVQAMRRRFVPRAAEAVAIGRTSVSLYPKVDASMSDPEKALAYQQNRAALAGADLDQRMRILALTERLDLMHTAESSLADWERRLTKNWFNFAYLTIISWHNA